MEFRRWLPNLIYAQWVEMCRQVLNQQSSETPDMIILRWTKNGKFSVKTTYEHLSRDDIGGLHTKIWKRKAPYKIKIFF